MNWEALGAIAEAIGAIAVLATLVYLAVQVKQLQKMQLVEALRSNRQERRDFFTSMRESSHLPRILIKLRHGEELSEDEEIRIGNHFALLWGLVYSEWTQDKLGLRGPHSTELAANIRHALSFERSINWIRTAGERKVYPDAFIRDVEAALLTMNSEADRGT